MSPVSDRSDIHNVAPDIINIFTGDSSFRFMKLPHVRQLQESSLGLSRGGSAGSRLDARHRFFACI